MLLCFIIRPLFAATLLRRGWLRHLFFLLLRFLWRLLTLYLVNDLLDNFLGRAIVRFFHEILEYHLVLSKLGLV